MSDYVYIEKMIGISDEEIETLAKELGGEDGEGYYLLCLDCLTDTSLPYVRDALIHFSKKYPDRLIEVRLSNDDVFWSLFIKKGLWYYEDAKIIYPEFNPGKLTDKHHPCE